MHLPDTAEGAVERAAFARLPDARRSKTLEIVVPVGGRQEMPGGGPQRRQRPRPLTRREAPAAVLAMEEPRKDVGDPPLLPDDFDQLAQRDVAGPVTDQV